MDRTPSIIIKKGTLDVDIVEANPIVWRGELYIFDSIRGGRFKRTYRHSTPGKSYGRFRKVSDGSVTSPCAFDLNFCNAYIAGDKVIVTGNHGGGHDFWQTESTDLIHWTEPHAILGDPSWKGYNTSVCHDVERGRYVLVFELGAPKELVGHAFTMFFAETKDFVTWRQIPGAIYGFDFYTGGPMLRWFGGYYYLFYLNGGYENGFETYVARSRDLKNWELSSRNPVLGYGPKDHECLPECPREFRDYINSAENINASDLDMCEFKGNLELVYSWGNQRGNEFQARAVVPNMTEQAFCEYFF